MLRIFKRSFVLIITFVLVFSMSVSVCFASETDTTSNSPDPTGWNSWTINEKISFVGKYGLDILCTVTGLLQGNQSGLDELIQDTFAAKDGYGVSSYYEFLATNLGFNDDTQTWTLSDDLVDFCNTLIIDYNDRVTMTYRYPANPDYVDASCFSSKAVYEEFVRVLNDNPDKFFYYSGSTEGGYYLWFYVFEGLESAVYAQPDLPVANCSLYDADWNNSFQAYEVCLLNGGSREDGYWQYRPNGYSISDVYQFENIPFSDITFKRTVSQGSLFSAPNLAFDFNYHFVISAYSGAFNCYKSVDDMKKDIGSQFIGRYTDSYTGTPSQTITQSEVNNVVNNYYGGYPDDSGGGSGSGSDNSGGSSSGGSGIIDGLGKLFGAIGNIIDKLFGFVLGLLSKVVDFFGSILEMFTDTLTKLIDVIPSGFNEFLAAMFPYIPEEWITIAEFILLVSAIGCVVALFKR